MLASAAMPISAGPVAGGAAARLAAAFEPSQQAPGPPTGLTATAVSSSEVDLSWTAPASDGGSPITGYNVYEGTAPGGESGTPVTSSTSTGAAVTGLAPGTYCFQVTAVNAVGESSPSNEACAPPPGPNPPGPPTGLTATAASSSELDLSWTVPASDGGSPITSYNVYEAPIIVGVSSTPVTSSTSTGAAVTGLVPGMYCFKVTAVNAVGESPLSSEACGTTLPPPNPPGPPTGLTATAAGSQVTLSWIAPTAGVFRVIGYNVYQGTSSGGEDSTPVNSASITTTSYTVYGLAPGTTYYFEVTAVYKGVKSRPSSEVSVTIKPAPTGPVVRPPGAPTGLTAAAGRSRVTLSWTAPASDGGSPITRYNVYEGTAPGGESRTPATSSRSTSAVVTGLAPGATYYFEVTAVNAAGQGARSNEAAATTVAAASSALPWPIISLAIALLAAAAAAAGMRQRRTRSQPRRAPGPRIEVVSHADPPGKATVRATGAQPTHTVRVAPL